MKTICSWDVGIKNLAYCIFEIGENITIKRWDIINFAVHQPIKCCGLKRSGAVCGNNATFTGTDFNGDTKSFCGTHKKMYKPFNFSIHHYMKDADTDSNICEYILPKKNVRCTAKAKCTNNKNYYCRTHSKLILKKMIKCTQLNKIKRRKCTSEDMQILAMNMYKKLNEIPEFNDVSTVYIENQPALTNATMKTIASLLFGYFIMKGTDKVKFTSPSNKLKIDEDLQEDLLNRIQEDSNVYRIINKHIKKLDSKEDKKDILKNIIYQQNKKGDIYKKTMKDYDITKNLGIEYTALLLRDDKKNVEHLMTYKKKDDMCDAFLLGYFKEKY